jgi:hypothetical protein
MTIPITKPCKDCGPYFLKHWFGDMRVLVTNYMDLGGRVYCLAGLRIHEHIFVENSGESFRITIHD